MVRVFDPSCGDPPLFQTVSTVGAGVPAGVSVAEIPERMSVGDLIQAGSDTVSVGACVSFLKVANVVDGTV